MSLRINSGSLSLQNKSRRLCLQLCDGFLFSREVGMSDLLQELNSLPLLLLPQPLPSLSLLEALTERVVVVKVYLQVVEVEVESDTCCLFSITLFSARWRLLQQFPLPFFML